MCHIIINGGFHYFPVFNITAHCVGRYELSVHGELEESIVGSKEVWLVTWKPVRSIVLVSIQIFLYRSIQIRKYVRR